MPEVSASKYLVCAGWEDTPHLDEKTKRELLAATPPHLRKARSQGIPSLGSGAIYPVEEDEILVNDFILPRHFWRGYALDVGWNRTAALCGALDKENDILYLYREYYRGQAEPSVHGTAIRSFGTWMRGAIDPASRGRAQADGQQLYATYTKSVDKGGAGLNLVFANNAVEAGLQEVWERLSTGRIKVFKSLVAFLAEYRIYRRDENGKIVKQNDHCFAAGTMLMTPAGPVTIEQFKGGSVISRHGAEMQALPARMTRAAAPTVWVDFSDGSSIRCTPDHRFMTDTGWVQAQHLAGQNIPDHRTRFGTTIAGWKSSSTPQRVKSSTELVTTFAESISNAMASAFTALCGSAQTVARRLMDSMSITKTRIARTTSLGIWPCCPLASTSPITSPAMVEGFQPRPLRLQSNGTDRPQGWSGIASTTTETLKGFTSAGSENACIAASILSGSFAAATTSAPTTARVGSVALLALTMSNAAAWLAAATSRRIATAARAPAHQFVRRSCVGVRQAPATDVFCLAVPGSRAFTLANGVLVHNCMDCMRYLVMTMDAVMQRMPAPAEHQFQRQAAMANRALDPAMGY